VKRYTVDFAFFGPMHRHWRFRFLAERYARLLNQADSRFKARVITVYASAATWKAKKANPETGTGRVDAR
jgi:hypothetical protein